MSGYNESDTLVLRSAIPRSADHRPDEPTHRTRFKITTVPYPVGGAGECSECPSDGVINQAVGEVRYRSSLFRSRIHEAVCLPCLPGLLGILRRLNEGPLTVALYSPCAQANTPRVRRLDHERAELIAQLVVAAGWPKTTEMLQGLFAATSAQLRRIAEVA